MYTTIEPRLIALLNSDTPLESYQTSPSLALPPLQDATLLKPASRPFLLEPDAIKRIDKLQHKSLRCQAEDEGSIQQRDEGQQRSARPTSNRALGGSSPQSLRKILDDNHHHSPINSTKKRPIPENKDEFVTLPQPPKKQKAAKQVVPPIIIGLFEPPPQAALFPPIASSSFHDSHGRNSLNTAPHQKPGLLKDDSKGSETEEKGQEIHIRGEKKRKDIRVRKRWTEAETNSLLLGVHKHGVGNWADILGDVAFNFNNRSGADLKDRFRTCRPAELRYTGELQLTNSNSDVLLQAACSPNSSLKLVPENVLDLHEVDQQENADAHATNKPQKVRAHRKRLEDLEELGIRAPFRKSLRRERRPFSEDEDREIFEGYKIYGPAWTRIQRDLRFNLQSRQPTDLRDRFRNKYPGKLRDNDKDGVVQITNASQMPRTKPKERLVLTDACMEYTKHSRQDLNGNGNAPSSNESSIYIPAPSGRDGLRIDQIISDQEPSKMLPPFQPYATFTQYKEPFTFVEQSSIEPSESMSYTQSFDWSGTITAPFSNSMGEMDISRLLLEPDYIDTNIINVSGGDSSSQSYYHMLGDVEHIDDLQDSTFV